MEKTCSACGQLFRPAFVFQIAVTADGQRNHFCSLECRKQGLGDDAFRTKRARRIAILNQKGVILPGESGQVGFEEITILGLWGGDALMTTGSLYAFF